MIEFITVILQFAEQGEKTGWTYIEIPADVAQQMKPGNKKSFRVKGLLDAYPVNGLALMPMGNGNFIMAVNAAIRKGIKKRKGAMLHVQLQEDIDYMVLVPDDLMDCMNDEPAALDYFNSLPRSHRDYFVKWIEGAKTIETRAVRIARAITALSKGLGYSEMMRMYKRER